MDRRKFGAALFSAAVLAAAPVGLSAASSEAWGNANGSSIDGKKFSLDVKNAKGWRIVEYVPEKVCSKLIHLEIDGNNIIQSAYFKGGCPGNLKAICTLIKGMHIDAVIEKLKGNTCGSNTTSCADQLTDALLLFKQTSK